MAISQDQTKSVGIDPRRISNSTGVAVAGGSLLAALVTLAILLGVTPIQPEPNVVVASVVVNVIFVLGLLTLVGYELYRLFKARARGRAAARLHIRIVTLFSGVAIAPAILVAVIASLTLNVGLDRWFSVRTKEIVYSAMNVAQAYLNDNASYLLGQTVSMGNDLERNRQLFALDRSGFEQLLTRQTKGRGLVASFLMNSDGSVIAKSEVDSDKPLPAMPAEAMKSAVSGKPVLIPPGKTNLVGAIINLDQLDAYLYTIRAVDPRVLSAANLMEANATEYRVMDEGKVTTQIAYGVIFLGFALVVLLAAIWAAIAVADRIVRPIRLLINAADNVAGGNLNVIVPVRAIDGDVGSLSRTFNKMISELRSQRDELIVARDEVDDRRRFIEAVLSGVTAAVIGVEEDRTITIANPSAGLLLGQDQETLPGRQLSEVAPEIDALLSDAASRSRKDFRGEIAMIQGGKERNLNVQITREESHAGKESYVITMDDITDLMIAQRSTAWSDVARRIAHEIKNPLTPIQLSAERLKRRYGRHIAEDDRAVFDQCTDTIVRQVEDIGRMVDEFSSFARMPKPSKERSDLRTILKDAVFLREMGNNHIRFIRDWGEEPLTGAFDSRMLGQAFSNLIKNAVEAIEAVPAGQTRDEYKILVRAKPDPRGDRLVVEIIDNGKGLPQENRHRILEPYMTMRDKGTGLGLPIVKKIIEEHGGHLEIHDAPPDFDHGFGAMFRVILPLADEAAGKMDEKVSAHGV
ncbi:two-component system nitrogen regulation sensor histidine kinase NtrY [Rhizobium sp. SG_E_25_P2]|uniref:sensor histidine kinase NtrY-like n=1 Tax=Rhizobium sp. SG_E_25_P2 TaxID=2879942 RepID=UPI0024759A60|nr:PAS domain-containing sensor histidine kinase [Rhizobium sp. SG_E_25_P2]MDH6268674.1 two-component system nitrogen regulation sensor histidine kinase NtrY [Rhizobium sp. SG_E_25_P2]